VSSLQDQLLKAGLIDEKKAKQVSKEKRKTAKVQRKSNEVAVDETRQQAKQAREQKAERDRQLNAARKAEAEKKAVAAQIKQLIEMNRQPKDRGELAYNFTDAGKIKQLYISNTLQRRLSNGLLAIVKLNDSYELVPAPVAERIAQRDERYLVALNAKQDTPEDDDPYADYQIPDDLMW
jgi:uncharacterized protein YaiL (DUF2058 family)